MAVIVACIVVSMAFVAGGIYHTVSGGPDLCQVNRQQTDAIRRLIINGTKRSRAFEATFLKLGLPPYAERLKQAQDDANSIPTC